MIVDEESRKLMDNVVKEDEVLDLNITSTHPLRALHAPAPMSPRPDCRLQTLSASKTAARRRPTSTPSTS